VTSQCFGRGPIPDEEKEEEKKACRGEKREDLNFEIRRLFILTEERNKEEGAERGGGKSIVPTQVLLHH